MGKGTSPLFDQEIPGQCAKENDGISLADKATDTNGDPSKDSKHTDDLANPTVNEPNGIFNNVDVITVSEGFDAHGHTSQESVVMIDTENHAIDEHEVAHDSSKAIDTNDDFDNDNVHESEDSTKLITQMMCMAIPIKRSVLLPRKIMFTMFVIKKSPRMIKIRSKKHLVLIMRLNKMLHPF